MAAATPLVSIDSTAYCIASQNRPSSCECKAPSPLTRTLNRSLHPRADFYAAAHPSAVDVLLAIEVADTSADYDREVKLPLYAQAGLPEVWLIDPRVRGGRIEVYARPQGGAYQQRIEVTADATLTSPTIPQIALAAADLLG